MLWNENYGDASAKALHSFTDAMNTIRQGMNALQVGIICCKFWEKYSDLPSNIYRCIFPLRLNLLFLFATFVF